MSKNQKIWLSFAMVMCGFVWLMSATAYAPAMSASGIAMSWFFMILSPIVFIALGWLFIKLLLRKDLAPDYLHSIINPYFKQNGLCFGAIPTTDDGNTCIDLYFMSQFNRPSTAKIVLRPAPIGLMQKRADIRPVVVEIACPPGGFGCARVPFPFPTNLQGKIQRLEIGATVTYPEGKGDRIRFKNGLECTIDAEFGGKLTNGRIADVIAAILPLSSPAAVEFPLPTGNSESHSTSAKAESQIYWQVGEPEIDVQKLLDS